MAKYFMFLDNKKDALGSLFGSWLTFTICKILEKVDKLNKYIHEDSKN